MEVEGEQLAGQLFVAGNMSLRCPPQFPNLRGSIIRSLVRHIPPVREVLHFLW